MNVLTTYISFLFVSADGVCSVPRQGSWSLPRLGELLEAGPPFQRQQLQGVRHFGGGGSSVCQLSIATEEADLEDPLRRDDARRHRLPSYYLIVV